VVGVDLGGTKVLAGVVDHDGKVLSRYKAKTRQYKGQPSELLDLIAESVHGAVGDAHLELSAIEAVGVGIPGALDPTRDLVSVAPNLGWINLPARDELSKRLNGITVRLENDVRNAALAESVLGAGAGSQSMVAIFVGTGIGGGLIAHGELQRGTHGGAGEVGHTVIRAGRGLCSCGQKGHLEALAARPAVTAYIARHVKRGEKTTLVGRGHGKTDVQYLTSGDVEAAVKKGDALATRAVQRSARYVGLACGSLVNLLDPQLIVLGGGLVDAIGQQYLDWAAEAARPHILSKLAHDTPIVAAKLGDDAGLLGAALTARQA
jgi:glucokinase